MSLKALALVLCFALFAGAAAAQDSTVRVMTFNIRYATDADGIHAWTHRKDRVASVLRYHRPDAAGLQEALRHQIDTLAARLPAYAWIGVGRDDGADGGEFSPIFYRRDRLALLDHGTFWLSRSPDVAGSRGWDAALPRIATWGRFRDRQTSVVFLLVNTHFDHVGQQARERSSWLIIDQMEHLADGAPIILLGDFNLEPQNPTYATLMVRLADTRTVSETPPHGPAATFFGFVVEPEATGRQIDYIFASPGLRVLRHATLTDHWHGYYPSDHLPVLADVRLGD